MFGKFRNMGDEVRMAFLLSHHHPEGFVQNQSSVHRRQPRPEHLDDSLVLDRGPFLIEVEINDFKNFTEVVLLEFFIL